MPDDSDDKLDGFCLPDISQVDQTKITKFDSYAPKWRYINWGLNL